MAEDLVIRAEGLGKKYLIAHRQGGERYVALRDVIARRAQNAWRAIGAVARRDSTPEETVEEFHALKDVSFEIRRSEAVGIIGRNGAGKSTLLKILSRITEPSEGEVTITGRVASLLEVGTGFHPELSGRENIFLNGAILGMNRSEIRRKFDEIVGFAGIEEFLDMPVKRYSSGMYTRLAFAIAAHLDSEILVIDEVLAVGDAEFQKKCLGKMDNMAKQQGRTVLFVSHQMSAIQELCTTGLLLERGVIRLSGPAKMVVAGYLDRVSTGSDIDLTGGGHLGPQHQVRLHGLRLLDGAGQPTASYVMNEPFVAQIVVECMKPFVKAEIGLKISSSFGIAIHYLTSSWEGLSVDLQPGLHTFEVRVPRLLVYPGTYLVGLWVLHEPDPSDDYMFDVTSFQVVKGDVNGRRTTIERYAKSGSEVYTPSCWKMIS